MTHVATSDEPAVEPALDPAAAAQARVGTLLDARWRLDALLGRGGMANVYAATHTSTLARAAIKVLHEEFAKDVDVRERFVREARIANSIQHPAKVAVLDEGLSHRGEIFLVMELLHGMTLDIFVREHEPPLSIEQKLELFEPVLELLGECHAAGIVHRDIKPANIFVTTGGQVKVFDFGIARLREGRSSVHEATKQGTVLGTPAYMAPEQALGLSDMVDGRADLWSVGACIFTLLSGRRVHHARSENESMVMAATRSAESIALVMPDLPVELVAFVDRSLAHDRSHRFPDARAMRGALSALLAGMRSGQITLGAKAEGGDAVVGRSLVGRDVEAEASPELRAETLEVLKSIWKHLAHFLSAASQYGPSHTLALSPLAVAMEEIGAALAVRPDSLVWDVSPFSFMYAGTPLWEGEKLAMERIAFRLFTHGMRKMQLRALVTEEEVRRLLAILTWDRAAGIAMTDDPVADIWAQRFEHVGHVAIDAFAAGSVQEIESFESEADAVTRLAAEVSMVTKGWEPQGVEGGTGGRMALEARAMQANLLASLNAATAVASSVAIDAQTRMLSALAAPSRERWEERFMDVLAAALIEGTRTSDLQRPLAALDAWADASGGAPRSLARFLALEASCEGRGDPETERALAALVARAMFPPRRFAAVLHAAASPVDETGQGPLARPSLARGVARVLSLTDDDALFDAALEHWPTVEAPELSAALFAYVKRWARGHEAALSGVVERAAPAHALAALGLLAALEAKEAGAAIAAGLRSHHLDVRRAALRALRGEEAQAELVRVLSDADPDLRREALAVVERLRLRAVGPAIVRRIQEPSFQALDAPEKRAWLVCLSALNPSRAEEIVVEMLERAPVLVNEANDRNRVIAAQILAGADSTRALAAAKLAARKIWWNSPRVREAAEAAVVAISERRAEKGKA